MTLTPLLVFAEFRRFTKMDERSLSDILGQAIKHYQKHEQTKALEEKFCYIWEILTLRDHLLVYITDPERIDEKGLADYACQTLAETDVSAYTPAELLTLGYIIDRIENEEKDSSTLKDCVQKLAKMMITFKSND
jgi:hypothetical protein